MLLLRVGCPRLAAEDRLDLVEPLARDQRLVRALIALLQPDELAEVDRILEHAVDFRLHDRPARARVRYLSDLSPELQQLWAAKMLPGDYELHPGYFDGAILGQRPEVVSIFDAFVHEQHHINAMCDRMGKPNLFEEFLEDKRPRNFGFLIRPTLKEFNDFMLLLDQDDVRQLEREVLRA